MNVEEIQSDKFLDARGLSCPMPMLKTKKKLRDMISGEILEVWGTDPGSKNDIPDFCKKNNHEFFGYVDHEDGYTKYYIKTG